MSKFQKKIRKLISNPNNALVIGCVFGNLENILEVYNTVFVIDENPPIVKSKNLVYRENYQYLNTITEVSCIFFDLNKVDQFEFVKEFWQRNNSLIIIEGGEPLGREFSKLLYATEWRCTSTQKGFHIWERMK